METGLRTTRQKNHRTWLRIVMVAVLVLGLLAGGVVVGTYGFLRRIQTPGTEPAKLEEMAKPGERINVLVLGLDSGVDGNGKPMTKGIHNTRTDTMMLVSLDPESKEVGVLSIPRDTRVILPGHSGYDKITHAHVYGGPKMSMAAVSNLLNVNVDYYVRMDFAGFARIVDLLGGVEMNIERNMDYEDPYQNLYIHIKAGRQKLNGEKALQVVRYRQYPEGDIARVRMQQQFIQALLDSLFDVGTILKLPSLVKELEQCVDTNIQPNQIIMLANLGRQVKKENIEMGILPGRVAEVRGENGELLASYWVPDSNATKKLVDKLIKGIDVEANSFVRVEVLNGTTKPGLAQRMADELKDLGYTVVNVGNATKSNYARTEIWDMVGDPKKVMNLTRMVNNLVPSARLMKGARNSGEIDIRIIVGNDYAGNDG